MTYHFNPPLYEHDQVTESFDFKEDFWVINNSVENCVVCKKVDFDLTFGSYLWLETLQQITKTLLALFIFILVWKKN
jgi:hypothetical protein